MINNEIINTMLIQIGDSTHNQDHVITPHSFSVINTIVNRPAKPIPDDVLFLFSLILLFFDVRCYLFLMANLAACLIPM